MRKKIITKILSIIMVFLLIQIPCHAQEETTITFENLKTFVYPQRRPFKTPYTSESKVDNVIPLGNNENTITLTLNDAPKDEFYFVSLYIMDDENGHRYLTPPCGVMFDGKEITFTGLLGGTDYRLMLSTFLKNQTISGSIKTGFIEWEGQKWVRKYYL